MIGNHPRRPIVQQRDIADTEIQALVWAELAARSHDDRVPTQQRPYCKIMQSGRFRIYVVTRYLWKLVLTMIFLRHLGQSDEERILTRQLLLIRAPAPSLFFRSAGEVSE
jgi:hypothetical protein